MNKFFNGIINHFNTFETAPLTEPIVDNDYIHCDTVGCENEASLSLFVDGELKTTVCDKCRDWIEPAYAGHQVIATSLY